MRHTTILSNEEVDSLEKFDRNTTWKAILLLHCKLEANPVSLSYFMKAASLFSAPVCITHVDSYMKKEKSDV